MHWLSLPEPRPVAAPAFQDIASAKAWLATQPQAQPMAMLSALIEQVEALDAAALPPSTATELLDLLMRAAVPAQAAIESRYIRKPLPMKNEDVQSFDLAHRLWFGLGVAYLRLAPRCPSGEKLLPLHRAACALRLAEYCHFLAASDCPRQLDRLLFGILAQAEGQGLLRLPLTDPAFPHLGESTLTGHLAWAFLLRLIDPYRFSAAQLQVANRALSRWRELAGFQAMPDDDPKARQANLGPIFGDALPEGVPGLMDVRKVVRKLRQRITSLKAGESPEDLKLGRELSAAACIRLLKDIDTALKPATAIATEDDGELEIAFGGEDAYALITGEYLNPPAALDANSASLAHQRMALFGFDRMSQMPTAVRKLEIASETWHMKAGKALRQPGDGDVRRQSPCLIAKRRDGQPRLGVLHGLKTLDDGQLAADPQWFAGHLEAGWITQRQARTPGTTRHPVFLLHDDLAVSLIVPVSAGVRPGVALSLGGVSVDALLPVEVVERGVDFVRYSTRKPAPRQ